MTNPTVSVMITTYNLRDYVAETIESVLNQKTDFAYEILVGDDGSTDGTVDIVRDYQEKYPERIRLYVMERDPVKVYDKILRASRNRINLIRHASGRYLIFLDGDDKYIDGYKLKKQVDELELPENRDCVACAHNCWIYWSDDRKRLINTAAVRRRLTPEAYWKYGMYFHSDTIMFRNIYNGEFPDFFPDDDYDDNMILYALLPHGDILYLPEAMVIYRQVATSSWNTADEAEKNLVNLIDWAAEERIYPQFQKASVYRHMADIFSVWRRRGRMPETVMDKYRDKRNRYRESEAGRWIFYAEQSAGTRFSMTVWLFWHLFLFVFVKIKKMSRGYRMN